MVRLPRLRERRERALLTQGELAERAGTTRMTIYRIERGEDARISTARRIAAALRAKPAELMAPAEGQGQRA